MPASKVGFCAPFFGGSTRDKRGYDQGLKRGIIAGIKVGVVVLATVVSIFFLGNRTYFRQFTKEESILFHHKYILKPSLSNLFR